ncbi:hypothetical protein CQW23_03168 [Capsicum baccatum]|uniref:Uncharacterized protein n=1 Tax=Capsicum baccatum TaxID=33114 RepID=A0A2G2XAZ4_CAPBA|nr:hypothetical protein CQW23_03168 [Capsicum baccatum]
MSHEEESPSITLNEQVHSSDSSSRQEYSFDMPSNSQSNILAKVSEHINRYQGMVYDTDGIDLDHHVELVVEESPNMGATKFYEMLNSAQEPLWLRCKYSELSIAVTMMIIKFEYNMYQEVDGSSFQVVVNENGRDLIKEGDEDILNKEEEGDEETSSEESNDEEGEQSEEEDFFDSNDSSRNFHTQEEASQPSQLNKIDIWVQSVGGKKKERVKGLGSLGQSVKTSKKSTSTFPKEIDEMIKSQVNALNIDLYSQLQNERHKNKRIRKELDLLMKHIYKKSSSNDKRSSQKDNQAYEDESDDDSDDVNESDSNPDG